jgi:hypothetical protein
MSTPLPTTVEKHTFHAKTTTDRVDHPGVGQKVSPDMWDENGVIVDIHPEQDEPFLVERMHDTEPGEAFRLWMSKDSFSPINSQPSQ